MVEGRELFHAHHVVVAHVRRMEERAHAVVVEHGMVHVLRVVPMRVLPWVVVVVIGPAAVGRHERVRVLGVAI